MAAVTICSDFGAQKITTLQLLYLNFVHLELQMLMILTITFSSVQFSSVTRSYPTLCNSMDCSTSGFPVLHQLPELAQTHVHWVHDCHPTNLILCHPLLLPPSIFPSIRVLSNESALLRDHPPVKYKDKI